MPAETAKPKDKVKVAVVGSGLGGLSVAYFLSTAKNNDEKNNDGPFEVHLYEKSSSLGMDSASISVPCSCEKCTHNPANRDIPHVDERVDVPMRNFFPGNLAGLIVDRLGGWRVGGLDMGLRIEYYPQLKSLYDHIGIPYSSSENSCTFWNVSDMDLVDPTRSLYSMPTSFPMNVNLPNSRSPDEKAVVAGNGCDEIREKTVPKPYFSFSCYKIPFLESTVSLPDLPSLDTIFSLGIFNYLYHYYVTFLIIFDYLRLIVISKYLRARNELLSYKSKTPAINPHSRIANRTLGQFFKRYNFSDAFVLGAFAPIFSGACTCTFETLLDQFPAAVILDYFAAVVPFGKASFVTCGIRKVAERLAEPVQKISLNTSVKALYLATPTAASNESNGRRRRLVIETENGQKQEYDHVIFATQANQAARILRSAQSHAQSQPQSTFDDLVKKDESLLNAQLKVLSRFPYEKALVITHTDESFLPSQRSQWKWLNFAKPESLSKIDDDDTHDDTSANTLDSTKKIRTPSMAELKANGYDPRKVSMATHLINVSQPNVRRALQAQSKTAQESPTNMRSLSNSAPTTAFLQTTNPIFLPSPDRTLSVSWFERCFVTMDSMQAVKDLDQVQGGVDGITSERADVDIGRRWFVGSYAYPGIPLLEGCVVSAAKVARDIGRIEGIRVSLPWSSDEGTTAEKEGEEEEEFGPLSPPHPFWESRVLDVVVEVFGVGKARTPFGGPLETAMVAVVGVVGMYMALHAWVG
ncbi:hypothetical protein HK102_014144 [Quaeritorhiza haematococci]|nr:hypothetical protein HK102_014144 [Quaeritorhiza haematococci]